MCPQTIVPPIIHIEFPDRNGRPILSFCVVGMEQ